MREMKEFSGSRLLLLVIVIFAILTTQALIHGLPMDGINVWRSRWLLPIALIAGTGFLAAAIFLLSFHQPFYRKPCRFVEANLSMHPVWRWLVWSAFFASSLIYAWLLTFSVYRQVTVFQLAWFKLTSELFLISLFSLLIKSVWKNQNTGLIFLSGLLFQSVTLKIASLLTRVSASPFVLNWEENHRIYYASLLASERIYGFKVPLHVIDFSLNLLNGIPFLLGDFPIWVHRLWYVLLTISITFLTAWALTQRLHLPNQWHRWLLMAFSWLYLLMEGEVKYNLQIAVILILLTVSLRHPWRSLVGVLLASFWAGLSRINWIPVPAMLAIALYFLEEPFFKTDAPSIARYLKRPVLWAFVGLFSAFLAYRVVALLPYGAHNTLSSNLSQDLLWYRLLPNATYAPGILLPLLTVSIPLWYFSLTGMSHLHWLRRTGLIAMMLTLLAGGIVASVKIGGGSDLHNLDAYWVLMLMVSAYAFFDRLSQDTNRSNFRSVSKVNASWALMLLLFAPIGSVLNGMRPYVAPDWSKITSVLRQLQTEIDKVPQGQEILVMYQRPLITFGYLKVELVPEYESVLVLDMAMSRDTDFLRQLYNDFCNHRFALIVAESQPVMLKGKGYSFGEENDVWFNTVTQPLLQSYVRTMSFSDAGIELYAPLENPCQSSLP